MIDDDAKKAILARRARFIAAAMVGAGIVACDRQSPEQLGKPKAPTGAVPASAQPNDVEPHVCLTIIEPETPAATAASAADAAPPPPRVCLRK